ncbi:hypothetical protein U1Q18_033966 [Sarracenia purpurea var. burkii]
MSTTTAMMSNHDRRFVTPTLGGVGPSNKRKEREGFDVLKPSTNKLHRPVIPRPGSVSRVPKTPEPASNNRLLAGYLAHEFLTKGTLFGQPLEPARAADDDLEVSAAASAVKAKGESSSKAEPQMERYQSQRYVEVANLLKTDEAHLPGIVNPSQLARFLQL